MAVPALASQIWLDDNNRYVQVGASTSIGLSATNFFYFVSGKITAGDGLSLLYALAAALSTSDGATTFVCQIRKVAAGDYRIQITHNAVGSKTVNLSVAMAAALGFSNTATVVPTGASGATATYPSYWWWSPDMPVSTTGQVLWDPRLSEGHLVAGATAHRSPDGTVGYVKNHVLRSAVIKFIGVEGYQRIYPVQGYTNWDWETYWTHNISEGRRLLFWRDRDRAVGGSGHPTGDPGDGSPNYYIEYCPSDVAVVAPNVAPSFADPPNVNLYNVTLDLWLSSNGLTLYDEEPPA